MDALGIAIRRSVHLAHSKWIKYTLVCHMSHIV